MVDAHHSFEDHTGEVLVRVEAPSLAGLFSEAGRALGELMGGDLPRGPAAEPETVELRASDVEALLVDFLDELIYRSERGRRIYREVEVRAASQTALSATVRGEAAEALRTAVKAATYHRLRVEKTPDGFAASVILDV